ncbi:MAG: hypothetical protein P1P85_04710 [Patescibacteria group bacterium]|nr:hypothetical protein [Patescibacteria group bacterium]
METIQAWSQKRCKADERGREMGLMLIIKRFVLSNIFFKASFLGSMKLVESFKVYKVESISFRTL